MFELTMHFKHEMTGILPNIYSNFELTVFELSVPDLYKDYIFMIWNPMML